MKTNVYFIINSKDLIIPELEERVYKKSNEELQKLYNLLSIYEYQDNINLGFENLSYVPRIGEKVQFDYKTLFDCDVKHITDIFPFESKEKPMQYRERLYKFVSRSSDGCWNGYVLGELNPSLKRPYVDLLRVFMDIQFKFIVTDVKTIMSEEIHGIIIYVEEIGE